MSPLLVEILKFSAQDTVHPLLRTMQMSLVKGFFALFPKIKKRDTTSALEVGTASALDPMDVGSL